MAKSDVQYIVKQLAKKYEETEKLMQDAGLALQDVMLSPEEQREFSKYKTKVDNELTFLSVSLSAAAQGKIKEVITKAKERHQSFIEPLHQAVDNLSEEIPEEVQIATLGLIKNYNEQIEVTKESLEILERIRLIAELPKRAAKQKNYLHCLGLPLDTLDKMKQSFFKLEDIFIYYESAKSQFQTYVNTLFDEEISTAGDLDE